jgi:hypothetical protein
MILPIQISDPFFVFLRLLTGLRQTSSDGQIARVLAGPAGVDPVSVAGRRRTEG